MRHAVISVGLGLLHVFGTPALAVPMDAQSTISSEHGMYVFEAYCVSCHGPGGRGDGPISYSLFRDFGVRPTDLGSADFQTSRTDLQLRTAVLLGGSAVHKTGYMPAWDQALTQGQVTDLVSYVRRLGSGPPPQIASPSSAVVDTLELGRFLYLTRCLACHGPDGRGDGPFLASMAEKGPPLVHPPDLSDYEQYLRARSDQNLESTIQAGFQHTGWPVPQEGWWDRPLENHEVRALIFFLRTLCIEPVPTYGRRENLFPDESANPLERSTARESLTTFWRSSLPG